MKPQVTLKIEETDDGAKPEVVAEAILKGTDAFHLSGHISRRGRA